MTAELMVLMLVLIAFGWWVLIRVFGWVAVEFFISSKPCHISGIRSNNNCESVLSPADGSDFPIEFALLSSELPVLYQGRFYGNHRPVGGSTLFASSTGASTNPFAVGCAHRLVQSLVCYLAVAPGAWF